MWTANWNGTNYPHGWQFNLPAPVFFVSGGSVVIIRPLDFGCATVISLMASRDGISLHLRDVRSLMPSRSVQCPCCGES